MRVNSVDDLNKLKERLQKEHQLKEQTDTIVTVGMSTCGIAAGARKVYEAILKEVEKRNPQYYREKTGCIGLCGRKCWWKWPVRPAEILYGKNRKMCKLLSEHIVNGNVSGTGRSWQGQLSKTKKRRISVVIPQSILISSHTADAAAIKRFERGWRHANYPVQQ